MSKFIKFGIVQFFLVILIAESLGYGTSNDPNHRRLSNSNSVNGELRAPRGGDVCQTKCKNFGPCERIVATAKEWALNPTDQNYRNFRISLGSEYAPYDQILLGKKGKADYLITPSEIKNGEFSITLREGSFRPDQFKPTVFTFTNNFATNISSQFCK